MKTIMMPEHLLSLPRYYLSKAIIAVKEGSKAEGKHWFDMAFETAVKKNSQMMKNLL